MRTLLPIGIGVLLLIGGVVVFTRPPAVPETTLQEEMPTTLSITLVIEGTLPTTTLAVPSGTHLLDATRAAIARSGIAMEEREYEGLGSLVTGFGSTTNGTNDRFWQFTVNGVSPMIGADALELRNADVVRWYFAESEY